MNRWLPKPVKPLGNGATVYQEASHFIHELGNRIMVLSLRMEIRGNERKERLKKRRTEKRRLAKAKLARRKS